MKHTNWLSRIFQYFYEVIVAADQPIFMLAMVLLPFIAPLLPALITAQSLQLYMGFPEQWTWIGVVAFELVAMLSQMASVSARMRLIDEPNNTAIQAEVRRTGNAYLLYLLTLIFSNVVLEVVNGISIAHVIVIACLTVGLSVSASLVNATRIYNRDKENKEEKIRQEKRADKMERFKIKHGTTETLPEVPNQFRNRYRKIKTGRPSIHQKAVFAYLDKEYSRTNTVPTFSDVMKELNLPQSTASRLRNEWIESNQNKPSITY